MSQVQSLGYLGFAVSDLEAWRAYATDFLGHSVSERPDGSLDLRMDDYASRIRLVPNGNDDVAYIGWEVSGPDGLLALRERLEANGVALEDNEDGLAEDRGVEDLIVFKDPDGIRCEAFYGPLQRTNEAFVSPLGVRFKTGRQGLGHVVLNCKNAEASEEWYTKVLGFKLSDYVKSRGPGGQMMKFSFLRCNSRHHSLALFSLPFPKQLQHYMLEVQDIDDVGRSVYRAEAAKVHNTLSLGRHSNDEMLSAYYQTPSGFDVEYGWGGLEVQNESWHVLTHDVPSAWGHKFTMPPMPGESGGE